jgi:hypothetical protein
MKGMKLKRSMVVLSAVAALAMPAAAVAKKDDGATDRGAKHGKKARPKPKSYVFKGLVAGVVNGTLQVDVRHGNSRGKKYKGQTLTFDMNGARIVVRDVNKDGKRNLDDVAVGDRVVVKTKLRPGAIDVTSALPAKHVVDKGPVPPADDSDDDQESEQPDPVPAS